jgi:hypothetical protein
MPTTSKNAPDFQSLRPFLSPALLRGHGAKSDGALLSDVLAKIEQHLAPAPKPSPDGQQNRKARTLLAPAAPVQVDGTTFSYLIAEQWVSPSWWPGGPKEQRHELVVVAVRGKLVAICASESATRDRIVIKLDDLARPLGREEIARAFLGPDAKTLWLEGIHTPTAAKADSKMLSGATLELALDPLGDQSYLVSAVRSRPTIPGLERPAKGKTPPTPSTVGSAPGKGRVWVGWPPGWNEFSVQLVAILKHADSGAKSQAPAIYGQLANVVSDLALAKGAYAVALVPQSLLGEDSTVTPAERETAYRWAHEARFELTPQTGASVEAAVSLADEYVGKVAITFSTKGEKIVADCRWTDEPSDTASERRQCELYLRDPKSLKVYYNSDHTLSDGALFESGWTDHPFNWEPHSFNGYAVEQEKPRGPVIGKTAKGKDQYGPLIDAIKRMDGNSLFDFVREKLYPTGYLACDDGAMELADFIHFDPASRKLSLIHVKGSGSDSPTREVSVSDFEVVVAQAIKNLRHLDRSNVHDALKEGEKHVIAEAVWLNGNLQTDKRAGLLAEIAKPGPITREVVIVQPRLTAGEKRHCEGAPNSARGKRLRQLNALMLAARASALTCGATFKGLMAE